MGRYTHLTLDEREEIMLLRHEGRSNADIARATGRDKATISREIKRNSFQVGRGRCYRASTAQRAYGSRRLSCVRPRLLDDGELAGLVRRLIVEERWSPEQVAGRIGLERPELAVSASTIYRAINGRRLDPPDLESTRRGIKARLRHKGKRRHRRGGPEERRGKIPGTRPIGERPAEVEERSRLGDWEGDTVVGRGAGACHARRPQKRPAGGRTRRVAHQTRRRQSGDGGPFRASGDAHHHLGPWHGVRRLRKGRGRHGSRLLLRAAPPSMATRQQREHQRPYPRVLPQGHRLRQRQRRPGPGRVRRYQPQTTQTPRLQDTMGSPPLNGVALALKIQGFKTITPTDLSLQVAS